MKCKMFGMDGFLIKPVTEAVFQKFMEENV